MATKKDLVEAYSFSRRRLVTAFVSGAPGGREVEPSRPGRTIVGGVALAVLLAAGAAIAGVFAPRTPDDWNQAGLIISKETGAAYVILPPAEGEEVESDDDVELRPVINTTSAKLILGADSEPTLISQGTIDDQRIGEDIGILGAPASVPTPSLLINSGWTACTGAELGIRVSVAADPDVVTAPGTGITVKNDGDHFVVVQPPATAVDTPGAYLLPVPPQESRKSQQTDNLLLQLQLEPTGDAVRVPREWLNLFPVGAPLDRDSFPLDGFGAEPETPLTGDAAGAVVGDLLEVDGVFLLVTYSGPVELDAFAAAVYQNVLMPNGLPVEPKEISARPGVDSGDRTFLEETHWPSVLPQQLTTDPCAQLTAERGEAPVAHLASPGDRTAVGDVAATRKEQAVDPGRGSYVLSGGWSGAATGAAPYVVDAKGRANPLVGGDAAAQLGYAEVPAPVVPDTWIELFGCGVNLSKAAALLPPTEPSESGGARCG